MCFELVRWAPASLRRWALRYADSQIAALYVLEGAKLGIFTWWTLRPSGCCGFAERPGQFVVDRARPWFFHSYNGYSFTSSKHDFEISADISFLLQYHSCGLLVFGGILTGADHFGTCEREFLSAARSNTQRAVSGCTAMRLDPLRSLLPAKARDWSPTRRSDGFAREKAFQ